jgi:hypothetical protein
MLPPDLYQPGSSYHQKRRWTNPHSLRCLETAVAVMGQPGSLLDVGCAEGVHVLWARERGLHAMGIDLAAPVDDAAFVRADLRVEIDLRRKFDWVLCWEVAEHLPATAADTLCDTLVRHLEPHGRLIFTAARKGQRGPGHLHCVDSGFWDAQFSDRGLSLAVDLSRTLRQQWLACSPRTPWYGKNVSVYWRVA